MAEVRVQKITKFQGEKTFTCPPARFICSSSSSSSSSSFSSLCLFCVEALLGQDQRICNSLEEKLQLYAELTELTLGSPEPVPHRHLLVQPDIDSETPRQASSLLKAALREGKKKLLVWAAVMHQYKNMCHEHLITMIRTDIKNEHDCTILADLSVITFSFKIPESLLGGGRSILVISLHKIYIWDTLYQTLLYAVCSLK